MIKNYTVFNTGYGIKTNIRDQNANIRDQNLFETSPMFLH